MLVLSLVFSKLTNIATRINKISVERIDDLDCVVVVDDDDDDSGGVIIAFGNCCWFVMNMNNKSLQC